MNDSALNPETAAPKLSANAPLGDGRVMAIGIPAFGLSIPVLTGLYGSLSPAQGAFWAGCAYFIALSAAIWLGNRWLLLRQRRHLDWFGQPARKLVMLIAANVLYTAPLTIIWLVSWYRLVGRPIDLPALEVICLTNVICVLFVTHAYETVFLIRERETDMLEVERLERNRVESELAALTAQIDPHFLFNSLNTLGHVIAHDSVQAKDFCDRLAEVYRYVLATRGRRLVPLNDELRFLRTYYGLLSPRFGLAIDLTIEPPLNSEAAEAFTIPAFALQTLLENAVKHNQVDSEQPLQMRVRSSGRTITFWHAVRPRTSTLPSSGLGLRNLDERCRLLTGRALEVDRSRRLFSVTVPLVGK